jgi:hypothetical protein
MSHLFNNLWGVLSSSHTHDWILHIQWMLLASSWVILKNITWRQLYIFDQGWDFFFHEESPKFTGWIEANWKSITRMFFKLGHSWALHYTKILHLWLGKKWLMTIFKPYSHICYVFMPSHIFVTMDTTT